MQKQGKTHRSFLGRPASSLEYRNCPRTNRKIDKKTIYVPPSCATWDVGTCLVVIGFVVLPLAAASVDRQEPILRWRRSLLRSLTYNQWNIQGRCQRFSCCDRVIFVVQPPRVSFFFFHG
jgi:hypothetical protein